MNFQSWYKIEHGFFVKERFEGILGKVRPQTLILDDNELKNNHQIIGITSIVEYLNTIPLHNAVFYKFTIENNILYEHIDPALKGMNSYVLKTSLTGDKKEVFLKNIFRMFGTYLTVFIKEHNEVWTGQQYIIKELDNILYHHSQLRAPCGDYTFIHNPSLNEESLGIDAILEHNYNRFTMGASKKGITLFIYKDDLSKTKEYEDNFTVNEKTGERFKEYTTENQEIIISLLSALDKADIDYDLIYQYVPSSSI